MSVLSSNIYKALPDPFYSPLLQEPRGPTQFIPKLINRNRNANASFYRNMFC